MATHLPREAGHVCRAGSAGRGMTPARTIERSKPVSGPDPRQGLGSI